MSFAARGAAFMHRIVFVVRFGFRAGAEFRHIQIEREQSLFQHFMGMSVAEALARQDE